MLICSLALPHHIPPLQMVGCISLCLFFYGWHRFNRKVYNSLESQQHRETKRGRKKKNYNFKLQYKSELEVSTYSRLYVYFVTQHTVLSQTAQTRSILTNAHKHKLNKTNWKPFCFAPLYWAFLSSYNAYIKYFHFFFLFHRFLFLFSRPSHSENANVKQNKTKNGIIRKQLTWSFIERKRWTWALNKRREAVRAKTRAKEGDSNQKHRNQNFPREIPKYES